MKKLILKVMGHAKGHGLAVVNSESKAAPQTFEPVLLSISQVFSPKVYTYKFKFSCYFITPHSITRSKAQGILILAKGQRTHLMAVMTYTSLLRSR